jgi:tyrosyl-tRNA synthetase
MDKIDELLTRGVANIIPGKDELKKVLEAGNKLNIYLGIDPTMTKIHLGHAFPLRKLQQFALLGHKVTFLIGDFTALVGDTSDKETERPILSSEEIEHNFQTYKRQAEKFLDFSNIKVVHNSEWLKKLTFNDLIRLTRHFSVNDFIGRELIRKRLDQGLRVRLDEVLYPLMQGYDSYFMDTDIQLGGTDQTFNMQAGRTLQKNMRKKESFIIANEFLMGTDGRKMSKSWGNAIWIEDSPEDMFAKVMAINDNLIIQYYTLATNVSYESLKDLEDKLAHGEHPMEMKKNLAGTIVSELYGTEAATHALTHFGQTVQQGMLPDKLPEIEYKGASPLTLTDLLVDLQLAQSKAEAKRLIEQGGVEIDTQIVTETNRQISVINGMIIRVGKRRIVKLISG